jgi:spore coat protein H
MNKSKLQIKPLFFTILISVLVFSCKDPMETVEPVSTNPDYSTASHSISTPNYAEVFSQDKVNTLEITMRPGQWDSLEANIKKNYLGIEFGYGLSKLTTAQQQKLGNSGSSQYLGLGLPAFVESNVKLNGKTWRNVGFRYDTVLPLVVSYMNGIRKMPFRLQADQWASKYPEEQNQRIYGFKNLVFITGYDDISMLRDKIGANVFRENGIPTAQTAFMKVYIDNGREKKYYGVYVVSEVLEDTAIKKAFGDNMGNIYEPETTLKFFSKGSFYKKNNANMGDYADVETFVSVLNSDKRKTNYTEWKASLEKNLDVNAYLKWLAINTAIRNDDGYFNNYYLYQLPNRKLTWVPSGFTSAFKFPLRTPSGVVDTDLVIDLAWSKATDQFPIIKYILDDPAYRAIYKENIRVFSETYFTPEKMNALFEKNQKMIAPYINGVEKEEKPYTHLAKITDFDKGLQDLKDFMTKQNANIKEYLK